MFCVIVVATSSRPSPSIEAGAPYLVSADLYMSIRPCLKILTPSSFPSFKSISLYTLPIVPVPIELKTLSAPASPNPFIILSASDCPGFFSRCSFISGPAKATVLPAANFPVLTAAPPTIIDILTGALSTIPLANCLNPSA